MSDVNHYKCPLCGAPINYVPGTDVLSCDYCGTNVQVSSLTQASEEKSFNWKSDSGSAKTDGQPEREYVCKSCGASIESFEDSFTTACPYCGNNVVVSDETTGGSRPNLIIPFGLKADEIRQRISDYLKKLKLLPNGFSAAAKAGELKGIYVPFWLFECTADGSISLHAQKESSVTRSFRIESSSTSAPGARQGNTRQETVRKISHYRLEREGRFEFSKLPVDASTHFDDEAMDVLEPYDYGKLIEFDTAYFTGYLAEKFNTSYENETSRGFAKVREGILDYFKNAESGYSSLTVEKDDMKIEIDNVQYAMLPVYALNFSFKGENHRIYANGQTGKVTADLPVDAGKSWKYSILTFLPVFALAFAICMFI
ncbi:MAG TPA: hypothetical protein DCO86_03535 [Spirochaetaceae bacterium]|nr:hypothetical protein [Spirochaetaceae bacterium]